MDTIPIPSHTLSWLRILEDYRREERWYGGEPCEDADVMLSIGMVEREGPLWRLTDIGYWLMKYLVTEGIRDP